MECLGIKKNLIGAAFAFATATNIIGCSESASDNSAGIFIETNTGNKASARIAISTANLNSSQ